MDSQFQRNLHRLSVGDGDCWVGKSVFLWMRIQVILVAVMKFLRRVSHRYFWVECVYGGGDGGSSDYHHKGIGD